MPPLVPFDHLKRRCDELLTKYLEPIISAEQAALASGQPMPHPDFDAIAAFRLLVHAELEGYFEAKAKAALDQLDGQFKSGTFATKSFASLVFFLLLRKQRAVTWRAAHVSGDVEIRRAEEADFKDLAQEALGFGRQFIAANNGVREGSLHVLSILMGYFPHELDDVLIKELDTFGKLRGDVAHDSWAHNTRAFDSAELERDRVKRILQLTKAFYEAAPAATPNLGGGNRFGEWLKSIWRVGPVLR